MHAKGKVHPRICYEGPEEEQRNSSTPSLASALDGGGWSTPHLGHLCQISYIWHVTCLAGKFIYPTSIVVSHFSGFLGLMLCCIVFVLLRAMFMFVCLKRLVSFLTFGLWYVNVAHFLFSFFVVLIWDLCCIFVFSLAMYAFGKLLFCAMVCIVSHSVCRLSSVIGSDSILLIW